MMMSMSLFEDYNSVDSFDNILMMMTMMNLKMKTMVFLLMMLVVMLRVVMMVMAVVLVVTEGGLDGRIEIFNHKNKIAFISFRLSTPMIHDIYDYDSWTSHSEALIA